MTDSEYYVQKSEEMLTLAKAASHEKAKQEFERLAEEYRLLAQAAVPKPKGRVQ